MEEFLSTHFLGNTIKEWGIAIGIFAGLVILIKIFEAILMRYLKKWSERTKNTFDDFLVEMVHKSVVPGLYFAGGYYATTYLHIIKKIDDVIAVAVLFIVTFYILRIITSAIKYFVYGFLDSQEDSEVKKKQARGILIIVNVIVWALGFVFLLDNLGKDVTTIIAGLGIGGIAIALAAQAVLTDLFSYFVIFFDRPFEIGDFIIVDDKSGTIEYIGIKTTRIRTMTGDLLICSNTDLTNSRVHNFKKLNERRVVFKLGVIYQTTHEQLKKIPDLIKEVIDNVDQVRFDRSTFSGYGDFSLDFETVYYVLIPDYAEYMYKQQEIYLAIFKKFSEENIEFAYPTQTVFVSKDGE